MKNKVKKVLTDYIFILIGTILLAAGMNMFLVPMQLSSGGVGAIGTVFLYLFKIPLSVTNLAFNIVLFIFAFKFLGKGGVIKTVAGVLFLSGALELTTLLPAFRGDIIISVVLGGALVGVGVGLVVRREASTGGSDLAGLIIKRFMPHISVATIILVLDCAVIIIAGVVFRSFEITFYSAIAMLISSKITDLIITVGDKAKAIYVMSEKNDEISHMIIKHFDRGVTAIHSMGVYTKEEKDMLFCVVSPKEVPYIMNMIRTIDKGAFVVISDAREVLGEGFKESDAYDKIEGGFDDKKQKKEKRK